MAAQTPIPEDASCESLIPDQNYGTHVALELQKTIRAMEPHELDAFVAEMPDAFAKEIWQYWMDDLT